MKVALEQEQGIPVLMVSGEVDEHFFKVLRAGITKLFKDGKNRMVVEFAVGSKIKQDYLREIAMLNVLAREMAGNIVLAIPETNLRQQVSAYSKPPALQCFDSRKAAVEGLKASLAISKEEPVVAPPPAAEGPPLTKTEVRDREVNVLHALRSKVEELTKQNQILQEKLLTLFNDRSDFDAASSQEQVKTLEKQLEEALSQLQKQPN